MGKPTEGITVLQQFLRTSTRQVWKQSYEDLMVRFLDLCVENRKSQNAKEGIRSYLQLTESANPQSLRKVVLHLLSRTNEKCSAAYEKANPSALAEIDDLEDNDSPDRILMSMVSADSAQDRADHEIFVPWVRFMWDCLRNVLDKLRGSKRMRSLYQEVCGEAFSFCATYNRTTEFRRVCNLIHRHMKAPDNGGVDPITSMAPAELEVYMRLRFVQLETCAKLQMWAEAYRTIKDEIRSAVHRARIVPPPHLRAEYYEQLSQVFWVSDNWLFHAYAWFKFYSLSAAQNRSLTPEKRQDMASKALLSALTVPKHDDAADVSDTGAELDAAESDRRRELTDLLNIDVDATTTTVPSRAALLAELSGRGIEDLVHPQLSSLLRDLAEKQPLTLVSRIASTLAFVKEHPELSRYSRHLEELVVDSLMQQLSTTYSSMTLASFSELTAGLSLSEHEIEQLIVRAARAGRLHVRIDHQRSCLIFGSMVLESAAARRQLSTLASRLAGVVGRIEAVAGPEAAGVDPESVEADALLMEDVFAAAKDSLGNIEKLVQARHRAIDRIHEERAARKKEQARQELEAKEEEERKKREEQQRLLEEQQAAMRRQAEEKKARKRELKVKKELLVQLGHSVADMTEDQILSRDLEDLEDRKRTQELQKQLEERQKREHEAKRSDYYVRALREASFPNIRAAQKRRLVEDKEYHNALTQAVLARERSKFAKLLEVRNRVVRMAPSAEVFFGKLLSRNEDAFHAKRDEEDEKAAARWAEGRWERAARRKAEADRKAAEEARLAAEAEAARRDAARDRALDDEVRARDADMHRSWRGDADGGRDGGRDDGKYRPPQRGGPRDDGKYRPPQRGGAGGRFSGDRRDGGRYDRRDDRSTYGDRSSYGERRGAYR